MANEDRIREQLRREIDAAEYHAIRDLWKRHSIAEDARDIPGLLSTLTDDCVYEVLPGRHTWERHEGAASFYTQLLTAFPDIHFDLTHIVIGPQGVFEEAHVTGTHQNDCLEYPATGEHVDFDVMILYPWDRERRLFRGERVHFHAEVGNGPAVVPR